MSEKCYSIGLSPQILTKKVLGDRFETVDWREVTTELVKLQKPVEDLMHDADKLTISEYVL